MIVLAGCSDDGGDADADATTTTEAADDTTEAAEDETTTTAADEGDDEGEDGSTTTEADETTETTAPDTSGEGQEGTGAPDAEQPDVSWDLDAVEHRGDDGKRIAYLCPPDGDPSATVWGTGTYTDDSSVCAAAVHAGIINPIEGGRVIIEIAPGEESYEGTEANGVASQDYAEWAGSFTFPVG
ncbi:hypothetical protein HC251_09085 [Iamia sp. SCSIO 61187]|nr:hypothetical protein HC251_09085 [Iamia sp. SCSIO 61187]